METKKTVETKKTEDEGIGTLENPTPEKTGVFTPRVTPENIGQVSGGTWNQLHSSDKPIDEAENK